MILLIYGFSLIYISAAYLGYNFNIFHVSLISLFAYYFNLLIFKSLRRFFIVSIISLFLLITTAIIFYYNELLDDIWIQIKTFFKSYYLIITEDTMDIDIYHQFVILLLISIIIMFTIKCLLNSTKIHKYITIFISLVVLIAGIFNNSFIHKSDYLAFIIMICAIIFLFLYNFDKLVNLKNRSFKPYFFTSISVILFMFFISTIFYLYNPKPLVNMFNKKNITASLDNKSNNIQKNSIYYNKIDTSKIDSQVNFLNIEVFKVKSNNTRYLKGNVFEIYNKGEWRKKDELDKNNINNDYMQNINTSNSYDYNKFYTLENVNIIFENISTNMLFTNSYGVIDFYLKKDQDIFFDSNRGEYYTKNINNNGYEYKFTSILPLYGGLDLTILLRDKSSIEINKELSIYTEIPDNFNTVVDLAQKITEGIDNNYDKVLAIENYLKMNYLYNINLKEINNEIDPIINFLFINKEGFCQQFASAFILLTRAIGIQSRYVTGFYITPFNIIDANPILNKNSDGYTSVFDSSYHSWPEVYFPEIGWILFEPTPGREYNLIDNKEVLKETNNITDIKNNYNIRHKFSLIFSVLILFASLYLLLKFIKNKKIINGLSSVEKILWLYKRIKFYNKFKGNSILVGETIREYATRIDLINLESDGIKMYMLVPYLERILYREENISDVREDIFFNYLNETKLKTKQSINIFIYYKILLKDLIDSYFK